MKPSHTTKKAHKVRIIRGTKPEVHTNPFENQIDSPIRSSVDSWLSSVPSIKQVPVKKSKKKIDKRPPIIEDDEEEYDPCRKWIILAITICSILIVCSIIGIVLAVIYRQ